MLYSAFYIFIFVIKGMKWGAIVEGGLFGGMIPGGGRLHLPFPFTPIPTPTLFPHHLLSLLMQRRVGATTPCG